jgi:hypothetical protein
MVPWHLLKEAPVATHSSERKTGSNHCLWTHDASSVDYRTGNLLSESSEKEGMHDDYLWALALACYAARETPLLIMDLFSGQKF